MSRHRHNSKTTKPSDLCSVIDYCRNEYMSLPFLQGHFRSFWTIMISKLLVVVQRINDKLPESLITKLAKEVHRVPTIQPSDQGESHFGYF